MNEQPCIVLNDVNYPSKEAIKLDLSDKFSSYLLEVMPEPMKAYDFGFADHPILGEYIANAIKKISIPKEIFLQAADLNEIIEAALDGFRKAWKIKYPKCLFGEAALRLRREELYQITILAVFNENKDIPNNVAVECEASVVKEKTSELLNQS